MANATSDISSTIEFKVEGLSAIQSAAKAVEQLSQGVTSTASAVGSLVSELRTLQTVANSIKMPTMTVGAITPTVQQPTVDTTSSAQLSAQLGDAVAQAQRMVRELDATGQEAETIYEMLQAAQLAISSTVDEARQLSGQLDAASANAKEVASAIRGVGDTDVVFDLDSAPVEKVKELSTAISEVQSKLAQGGDAGALLDANEFRVASTQLEVVSNKLHEVRDAKSILSATAMDLGNIDGARADVELLTYAFRELNSTTTQGVGQVSSEGLVKAAAEANTYSEALKEVKVQQEVLRNWDTNMAKELKAASDAADALAEKMKDVKSAESAPVQTSKSARQMFREDGQILEKNTWASGNYEVSLRDLNKTATDTAKTQDEVAAASGQAGNSLSNQRYALYDVAEAYRSVSYVATAWITASVGTSVMFESAFADVIRTVGLTRDSVGEVRDEFIELSTQIPKSFTELSEIAALGGQLGIEREGVEEFTSVIAKLGSTTDLTTEAASFMVGRFQTILGTAPDEFERLASAVLKVGVSSTATESEIAKMSIELAAISAQAGLSEEDIIALSATLASAGVPAERARSAIQDSFGIIDDAIRANGDELKVWAEMAGVSVDEFANAWGTKDFMGLFSKAMEGLSTQGANGSAVLDDMGISSKRTEATLLTLAASTELLTDSIKLTHSAWDENTALTEQFDIVAQTTSARLSMLKNEVLAFFDVVGSAVTNNIVFDAVISAVQGLTWAVRELTDNQIGKFFASLASGSLAIVGVMASIRATQALVTASSFALASANSAVGTSFATTAKSALGLVRTLLTQKSAVDVAGTSMTVAATKTKGYTAAVLEGAAAVSAFNTASAFTPVTTSLDTTFASTTSILDSATVATKANTTANIGLAGSMKLVAANTTVAGTAIKATTGFAALSTTAMAKFSATMSWVGKGAAVVGTALKRFLPVMAISAGFTAIGWVMDKFRGDSAKTAESWTGLRDALTQDTQKFNETGEALSFLAVAVDSAGNSMQSDVYNMKDDVDATKVLAETKEELSNKLFTMGDALGAGIAAQEAFKDSVRATTEEIYGQIVAIDEATVEEFTNKITENPIGTDGAFKRDSWSETILAYQELATAGERGAVGISKITEAIIQGGQAADDIRVNYNALQAEYDELFDKRDILASSPGGQFNEDGTVTAEYQEVIDKLAELKPAVDNAKFAFDMLNQYDPDFSKITLEDTADQVVRDAVRIGAGIADPITEGVAEAVTGLEQFADTTQTAFDLEMGLAEALYNLGGALAENGSQFDIYSAAGRDNLSALEAAMQAAAEQSGGDMSVFASNVQGIILALEASGVESVKILQLVAQAYKNITSGGGVGGGVGLGLLMTELTTAKPMLDQFSKSIDSGYVDAMNRLAKSSGRGGAGVDEFGNKVKDAKEEVRTLSDYVGDLSKVMSRAFEFRWGQQQSLDDVADGWEKLHDWAKDAAEQIDSAKKSIDDAQKSIRDAKNELKDLEAQLLGLQSDEKILEYQLRVAVDYGDTLREREIRAELAKNRADQGDVKGKQADAKVDVDTGNKELSDATKELSQAQKDAQKDLSGTSASAREQRDMVWDLLKSYQSQIEAYAETGASTQDLERYTKQLQGEFEDQLRQLGYNQTEVKKYSGTFSDLTTVINNVPRNITVNVDANPAQRALGEFRAQLAKTDSSLNTTKSNVGDFQRAMNNAFNGNASNTVQELQRIKDALAGPIEKAKELFGWITGASDAGSASGAAGGGFAFLMKSSGGLIPGPGLPNHSAAQGTDTVPAMLTPGEFVLKRSAVQALGVPFLNALNNTRGAVPATNSTYVHMSNPEVQLMEIMPHQFNALVTAVSNNVQRAMVSGADLSVASSRANQRAVKAGAN